MLPELPFQFDADTHTYTALDTGEELPHITGLLESAGWVDSTWMTEESSVRGTAVHGLTARHDLGTLQLPTVPAPWRGYLLAYKAASTALRPAWSEIEVAAVHPVYRFGGRPDRVGRALQQQAVLEVKSGAPSKAHQVQTALQAILVSAHQPLPAEQWLRLALYLTPSGRYKLELHKSRADYDEAFRILQARR